MSEGNNSSKEVIHYGPVWGRHRRLGESFSLCNVDDEAAMLSTHEPMVTCETCLAMLGKPGLTIVRPAVEKQT